MTKSQLVTLIAQQLNMSREDAETAVNTVFDSISGSLEAAAWSCGVSAVLTSKSEGNGLAETQRRGQAYRWRPKG